MLNLFFNPRGRITRGPFWLGFIVLTVLGAVLGVAPVYVEAQAVTLAATVLSIALIYPSLCVYGKRFHDAGMTAWLFAAVVLVQIVVNAGVQIWLTRPYFERFEGLSRGSDAFQAARQEVAQAIVTPALLFSVVVAAVLAFVVSMLPSDPGENRFGPAPGGGAAPAPADGA